MKKNLFYLYLVAMFGCILGGGSLPQPYQHLMLNLGLFLFGMFFVIGMPVLWNKKTPLRGEGVNVEFAKHPIIYAVWLLLFFSFGVAMVTFAFAAALEHYLGVVLVPGLV